MRERSFPRASRSRCLALRAWLNKCLLCRLFLSFSCYQLYTGRHHHYRYYHCYDFDCAKTHVPPGATSFASARVSSVKLYFPPPLNFPELFVAIRKAKTGREGLGPGEGENRNSLCSGRSLPFLVSFVLHGLHAFSNLLQRRLEEGRKRNPSSRFVHLMRLCVCIFALYTFKLRRTV